MGEQKKVVWVLGSGFSKSLGGPLLEELFDRTGWVYAQQMLREEYTKAGKAIGDEVVQRLDRLSLLYAATRDSKGLPWRNAEEFLETWETATIEVESQERVRARHKIAKAMEIAQHAHGGMPMSLWQMDLSSTSNYGQARLYLAAMTHEFVHGMRQEGERWDPYVKWAGNIEEGDQIITFNYDLVVEKAFEKAFQRKPLRSCKKRGQNVDEHGILHKLHGSVDWKIFDCQQDKRLLEVENPFMELCDSGYQAGIGIPGPGKLSASSGLFLPQWNRARRALKGADVIIVVGYSFPATDNFAKNELLEAIRINKQPDLAIHLVLGPDRNSSIIRMEKLLRWVLKHRQEGTQREYSERKAREGGLMAASAASQSLMFGLSDTSMYAEDFLIAFNRSTI